MKQSKIDSILESFTNILIGFLINFIANMLIFPLFGWQISIEQNIALGICYTLISFVRQYTIRRVFNGKTVYQAIFKGHQND